MKTLAICNQKGGQSKSTTTAALGAILAAAGRRCLLCDLDPQASLTQSLGEEAEGRSLAEVLGTNRPGRLSMQQITRELRPNLWLAPSDMALSVTEAGLMLRLGREYALKSALAQPGREYDLILLDCPPSLSILTTNALAAADACLLPVLPAPADLRGLQIFLSTLEDVRPIAPNLEILGVIVSQFDQRINSHRQSLAALERAGLPVLAPPIPRSVRVQEAQAARQLLTEYDPGGKVTEAYQQITRGTVIPWLEKHEAKITS